MLLEFYDYGSSHYFEYETDDIRIDGEQIKQDVDMKIEIKEVIKLIEKFIEDVPKENEPILVKKYIDYGAEYKCPRCEETIIQHEGYYNTGKYCCNCGLQFIWNNGKKELINELTNMIDNN